MADHRGVRVVGRVAVLELAAYGLGAECAQTDVDAIGEAVDGP
ncbi:hypothetical protein [Nonomuraea sp. NPDC002799]